MIEIDRAERINRILNVSTDNFVELAIAAELSPSKDFIDADLSGVTFAGCDLSDFDFTYADLRNAKWEGVIRFPDKVTFALRGIGNDIISPHNFDILTNLTHNRKKWSDKFFSFKLIVDNFGPVEPLLATLGRILSSDKSRYMRTCSFTYLAATYANDLEAKEHCRVMALDGNSFYNRYRFNKTRRLANQLTKYLRSINRRDLVPGAINPDALANLYHD